MNVEWVAGTLITVGFGVWGLAKYLMDRQDKGDQMLHDRLATTVKKDEYNRQVNALERRLDQVQEDVREGQRAFQDLVTQLGDRVNTRLDNLMLLLGQGGKNDPRA